ncbi:MAG: hypothetical protein MR658_06430 [Campylobacter sp.]|nr:hypothetical protein [Campylobacter sp.]MCI6178444.1 hypothetical protein [Campylobacter sp.]MDD7091498.1 hypothetical protein [Campylobacteraceae bacterium]MDY5285606.1 hypothetical protein [Campylobacter sp.]
MTQEILEFPSFLPAGLPCGAVSWLSSWVLFASFGLESRKVQNTAQI